MEPEEGLRGLVEEVVSLAATRFPAGDEGAAGVLLEDGVVLTSTAPPAVNPSVELCHEVGAYAEAYKRGAAIVASVCLHREGDGSLVVLSPCGVCLERLAVYGPRVRVGVPHQDDVGAVSWVQLSEALPHYWRRAMEPSQRWPEARQAADDQP